MGAQRASAAGGASSPSVDFRAEEWRELETTGEITKRSVFNTLDPCTRFPNVFATPVLQVTESWQPPLYYAAFSNVFGAVPHEFVLQRIETGEARSIESSTLDTTSKDLVKRPLMQTLKGIQQKQYYPSPEAWKCRLCTVSGSCPHSAA